MINGLSLPTSSNNSLTQLLDSAVNQYRNNQLEACKSTLHRILNISPLNTIANEIFGFIAVRENDHVSAIKYLSASCQDESCSLEAMHQLGTIFLSINQLVNAEFFLEKAFLKKQTIYEVAFDLASCYGLLGKFQPALNTFLIAEKLASPNADLLYNIGLTYELLNNVPNAITYYQNAITANPDYTPAIAGKGMLLHEMKSYSEALNLLNIATSLDPVSSTYWNNKGVVLHDLGRFQESIECFDKSIV